MENFDTKRLISEIQSRPCLWDSNCEEYSNRELKKRGWEELVELFGRPDMSILEKRELGDALQKKWKSLRGCYVREVRRQKEIKLGSSNCLRKSEYVFFKQLHFLKNVVVTRDEDGSKLPEDSEEPRHEEAQSSQSQEYDIKPELIKKDKKLKKKTNDTEIDPLVEVLSKSLNQSEQREKSESDEDRMFLLSLLSSIKSVPDEKKMTLKINIMKLINEALQDKFREKSTVRESGRFYDFLMRHPQWLQDSFRSYLSQNTDNNHIPPPGSPATTSSSADNSEICLELFD